MHDKINPPFSKNGHVRSTQNQILSALPKDDYARILPFLEPVTLTQGKFIYQPEEPIAYVHFPISGMISITSTSTAGKTIEIGTVGREGMAGIDIILGVDSTPFESMVRISGAGFRVKTEIIKAEFKKCGALQNLILRYTHALLVQSSQAGACNRLHTIEQKLATWLMITRDRIESEYLPLTHDFIAMMIGANRPSVSMTAYKIQSEGIIEYSRGKINILNPERLENLACDCYQTIKAEFAGLAG